jgi:FMN-dependent oxidoreductase (nitrilotriacetate monooxygenase family)
VVRGLWDCWGDDALVADRATGVYLDPAKLHPLNHEGAFFKVQGPVNIGRTPQGQPIVMQAGGSEPGQALAARTADIVFTVEQDFDEAKLTYTRVKSRLAAFGRAESDVTIMPGVMPVIGRTDDEAMETLARLQSYVDSTNGLALLSDRLGQDMSQYALDGPIPELTLPDTYHSFIRVMLGKARREGWSLRQLYNLVAANRGHWVLVGSPKTIADIFERWFVERAADGFNIMPTHFPGGLDDFVNLVVPLLQERGLFRRAYGGRTLRDHLGLARPARLG